MALRHGWSARASLMVGAFFVLGCGSDAAPVDGSRTVGVQPVPGGNSAAGSEQQTDVVRAHATIAGEPGSGIEGEIRFIQTPADATNPEPTVSIVGRVAGLTEGVHGFHIHEIASCSPLTAAGGHFDPGPSANSGPDINHPFHMGDIPNLVANAAGVAHFNHTTSRVTLSAGPLSVFDTNGSAVIVHLNPDQGITGAIGSGVSGGARIACGVIELDP